MSFNSFHVLLLKRDKLGALALVALCAARPALACPICVVDPNSPMARGARNGVILLVLIVAIVLGAIATTAFRWILRARQLERAAAVPGNAPLVAHL